MSICKYCSCEQPAEEFRNYTVRDKQYTSLKCRACERSEKNAYYAKKRVDPEWRLFERVRRYGISIKEYEAMLEFQEGLCAVCRGEMSTPYIDHDHDCCPQVAAGRRGCGLCVRGLLCPRCNIMLGSVGDRPEILARAIEYLCSKRFS